MPLSWAHTFHFLSLLLALNVGILIGHSLFSPVTHLPGTVPRILSGEKQLRSIPSLHESRKRGCILMLDSRFTTKDSEQSSKAEIGMHLMAASGSSWGLVSQEKGGILSHQPGTDRRDVELSEDGKEEASRALADGRRRQGLSGEEEALSASREGASLNSDARESHGNGTGQIELEEGSMEAQGMRLPYYVAARAINRMYAERHGYRFVFSDGAEFARTYPDLHSSWFKVPMLSQQLKCCCDWAFFLDSDAYFRMEDHSLSIEAWLNRTWDELLRDPKEMEKSRQLYMRSTLYLPEDPRGMVEKSGEEDGGLVALVPRNYQDPNFTWAGEPDNFVNAGVTMWRNCSLSHKMLGAWLNGKTEESLRMTHPFEQKRLNTFLMHKFSKNIGIFPYSELTGPQGRLIRHMWHTEGEDARQKTLVAALLGTLLLHQRIDIS